jgi:chloramphenicol O-acetyltransferase type A
MKNADMTLDDRDRDRDQAQAQSLDLRTWPRRSAFDLFRHFDKPWFSVCVRVDVTALKPALAQLGGGRFSLACHHAALREAHRVRAFRLRFEGTGVQVLHSVRGSTTVARPDGSFGFATLPYDASFQRFAAGGAVAMQAARDGTAPLLAEADEHRFIHFTTLPWLHFTSFTHARELHHADIPKIAFGRVQEEHGRQWMPLALEVHHALVDGADAGDFVTGFEAALRDPLPWLTGAAT